MCGFLRVTVLATFQMYGNSVVRRQDFAIWWMDWIKPGPPALIALFEISSLPGALSGCKRSTTVSTSAQVKGVGLSAGGCKGSTLSSVHSIVGALVPWKRGSACSSGVLVREHVWVCSGGTARDGDTHLDVA